ncbi:hypothetical protein M1563_04975 [Patescibacteria group bacterium]|nr:hypothetical protein [Patescibacteria group bacterium]
MKQEILGVSGIDLTSAGFLHHPRELFEIAHLLNQGKSEEDWIQIELYPTLPRFPRPVLLALNGVMKPILRQFGLAGMPVGLDEQTVRSYQQDYPDTKVSRIHLPFFYNGVEFVDRIRGDQQMNGPIKGLWTAKNLAAYLMFFGRAVNRAGVNLAFDLRDQSVGINAHPTIIEGFAKEDKLSEVSNQVAFVLAEADARHPSKLLPEEAVYHSEVIIKRLVQKYSLDGFLLSLDHELSDGLFNPESLSSPLVRAYTRAIHFAKGDYSLIKDGDQEINQALAVIKTTSFDQPVRLALENYPLSLAELNLEEKVGYFKNLIAHIK